MILTIAKGNMRRTRYVTYAENTPEECRIMATSSMVGVCIGGSGSNSLSFSGNNSSNLGISLAKIGFPSALKASNTPPTTSDVAASGVVRRKSDPVTVNRWAIAAEELRGDTRNAQ